LTRLNAITSLEELTNRPGDFLHKLKGDRKGQYIMPKREIPPIHPGKMLLEEFIKPYKITPKKLAQNINVAEGYVQELIQEKRDITPPSSSVASFTWEGKNKLSKCSSQLSASAQRVLSNFSAVTFQLSLNISVISSLALCRSSA
ncbi:9397_t:CDS:2, partial [Funneliformis geosporum]